MKTDETLNTNEETKSAQPENELSNIIIVGECTGTYSNRELTKEFTARVLVSARPDGTVIVHDLCDGIRPICYIDGGAEISLAMKTEGAEVDFKALTEDLQTLSIKFTGVTTMQGVPSNKKRNDSLAMSILLWSCERRQHERGACIDGLAD